MIVGIVVVLAVTFSQRGAQSGGRRYFGTLIGWASIPVLSLLAGMSFMLFFREKPWFAPSYAVVFAVITAAILAARGLMEVREKKG